jgi:hypothetical protein
MSVALHQIDGPPRLLGSHGQVVTATRYCVPTLFFEAITRRDRKVQIGQTKTGNKATMTMFPFISHTSTMRRTTSVRMACSMLLLVRSESRPRLVSLLLLLGWRGRIIKSSFHQLKLLQKVSK